jgi:hypothetical protein
MTQRREPPNPNIADVNKINQLMLMAKEKIQRI